MRRWVLLVAVSAVALATCAGRGAATPPAVATPDPATPQGEGVTVSGLGRVTGKPDVLQATLGVSVTRSTVQEALDGANAAAGALVEALRGHGVAERDIGTRDFGISPEFRTPSDRPDDGAPQITGYTVRNILEVKLRDLGRAGEALAAATRAGGDAARVEGIGLVLAEDAGLVQQARDAAFADARAKAEQYARLADQPLGALVSLSEVTTAPPIPLGERAAAEAQPTDPVPVLPGQQEVTVTVTARWALG